MSAILIDALELLLEVEKSELQHTVSELKKENGTLIFQAMDNFITDRTMAENDRINDIAEMLSDFKHDHQFNMAIEVMEEFEDKYGFSCTEHSLDEYFHKYYRHLSVVDCNRILTILKFA